MIALAVVALAYGLYERWFWGEIGAPIGRWDLLLGAATYPGFLLFVTGPAWAILVWRRTSTVTREQDLLRDGHLRGAYLRCLRDGVVSFATGSAVLLTSWTLASIGLPAEARAPTGAITESLLLLRTTPLGGLGVVVLGSAVLFGSILAIAASIAALGWPDWARALVISGFWLLIAGSVGGLIPSDSMMSIANVVDPILVLDGGSGVLPAAGALCAIVLSGWGAAVAQDRFVTRGRLR